MRIKCKIHYGWGLISQFGLAGVVFRESEPLIADCYVSYVVIVAVFELVRFCWSQGRFSIHFQYSRYTSFPPCYNELDHETS